MAKVRDILDGFLEQEKTPVLTVLSILTTLAGWVFVMLDLLNPQQDWRDLAPFFLLVALVVGSIVNGAIGIAAAIRGEYCGGGIAAVGIALWILTAFVFFLLRGNHLWS